MGGVYSRAACIRENTVFKIIFGSFQTLNQVVKTTEIYFDIVRDTSVQYGAFCINYGKMGIRKSTELILHGRDLAYEGYEARWAQIT